MCDWLEIGQKSRWARIGSKNQRSGMDLLLAGEIGATVFGFDGQKTVRRAVKQILANLKSGEFNSLEITRVASKRFLGLPYASVSAHSRHIQENAFLLRAKDHQEWDRAKLKAA
jgi:hypothetical protein